MDVTLSVARMGFWGRMAIMQCFREVGVSIQHSQDLGPS